ncbi:MAG: RecQ family ATP-dependent DNA helicase [Armatimonadota bacterium]|nr:RecQ family ATP-dependent DNA helicase [Armatimonadota bacterium]
MSRFSDFIRSVASSAAEPAEGAGQLPAAPNAPTDPPRNPALEEQLKSFFGYEGFRPGQQAVIESVMLGQSVFAIMPTGAGKSLCYQLPALLMEKTTFVVSPLIALMRDQVDGLPEAVQKHATVLNSSLESDELERRLAGVRSGQYKLVYAAPERLRQMPFLHALRAAGVSAFVIDEAHCISAWGHDFRPDYLFIGNALDFLGKPPVLAMTATATTEVQREVATYLGRQLRTANFGTFRPNLRLESRVLKNNEEKMRELVRLCQEAGGTGIVYVSSRRHAEQLAGLLRRHRVRARHYHAGMESEERSAAQDDFMDDRYRVMVATVAFGMGVDKSDVRFVIHFSLPHSLENYYQEAGRAGRDGKLSRCVLLSTPSDKGNLTRWMKSERVSIANLRDTYRAIAESVPTDGAGTVRDDDLQRETQLDETRVRVAISLLEKAGMLSRRLDLPTTVTIKPRDAGAAQSDPRFAEFMSAARLRVNQSLPVNAVELAKRVGIPAAEIEGLLLQWQDSGWLYYRGSGRAMFLERPRATREMRALLDRLIARYEQEQIERIDAMASYARGQNCLHGTIAQHFGNRPIGSCGVCDVCVPDRKARKAAPAPTPTAQTLSKSETRMVILKAVASLPYPLGRTGITRLLKGSIASSVKGDRSRYFGALSGETKSEVETAIRELLDAGYLKREGDEYPLLYLTEKGTAKLKAG